MKFYSLVLSIFVVFTIGCSSDSKQVEKQVVIIADENSKERKNLFAKTIQINEDLFAPTAMVANKGKLIIVDQASDYIFKVLELPSLKPLYSAGKKGQGPGELSSPFAQTTLLKKDLLEIQDNNEIKRYRVKDSSLEYIGSKLLPQIGSPINRLTQLNDTLYVADNAMNATDKELIKIDLKRKKIISRFGDFYRDDLPIQNGSQKIQTYLKSITANGQVEKFATFYNNFNRFKIYNFNGDLIKQIEIQNSKYKNKKYVLGGSENIMYQIMPTSTPNLIFTIELGKSKQDLMENLDQFKPILNVWNWDGEQKAQFTLDKPITSLTIHDNKIYATSISQLNEVYIYDLPKIQEVSDESRSSLKEIETSQFKSLVPKAFEVYRIEGEVFETDDHLIHHKWLYLNTLGTGKSGGHTAFNIYFRDTSKVTLDEYFSRVYHNNEDGIERIKMELDDGTIKEVINYKTIHHGTAPDGGKLITHIISWAWPMGDKIMQLSYASDKEHHDFNFHTYFNDIINHTVLKNG